MDEKNALSKFISYSIAIEILNKKFSTTPDEIAVWIFLGYLKAQTDVFNYDHPPRFKFNPGPNNNFKIQLNHCWFIKKSIEKFYPLKRYITGKALIAKWGTFPHIVPLEYIMAKIEEGRLEDIHPLTGFSQGSYAARNLSNLNEFPSLKEALFALSEIEEIERIDFGINLKKTAEIAKAEFYTSVNNKSSNLTINVNESEDSIKTPKPVVKKVIALGFQDLHFDYLHWKKNLASPPDWLLACRIAKGNKGVSATWDPVAIGLYLLDKKIKLKELDAVFYYKFKDWKEQWEEKTQLFR